MNDEESHYRISFVVKGFDRVEQIHMYVKRRLTEDERKTLEVLGYRG